MLMYVYIQVYWHVQANAVNKLIANCNYAHLGPSGLTHTHTHTHVHMCIHMSMCVCLCV
jgi:hypothetical protein